MPVGDYIVGLAWFAAIWGLLAAATWRICARRLTGLPPLERSLAAGLLFTALLLLVQVVPGALTILSREAVAVCAAIVLAAVWRLGPVSVAAAAAAPRPDAPPSPRWSWAIAGCAAVVTTATVALFAVQYADAPVVNIDTLTFHLPGVARWIQSGSMWHVEQFVPLLWHGAYPNNGIAVLLGAELPWRNDAFVRLVPLPFVLVTAAATYAIARELRAAAAPSLLGAALVVAFPVVTSYALDQVNIDIVLLASLTIGALFLLRHIRTAERSDLLLGGLGLGLGFGTKWNGVSGAVAIVAAWGLAVLLTRGTRATIVGALRIGGLVLLGGSFWLLRNLIATGNPLFPVEVAPLGITIFGAPANAALDTSGFAVADYLTNGAVMRDTILPQVLEAFRVVALPLAAATVAAGLTAVVRLRRAPRTTHDAQLLFVAGAALLVFASYLVTPTTAYGPEGAPLELFVRVNARYAAPALILAVPLAAWCVSRAGRFRPVGEALLALCLLDALRRALPWQGAKTMAASIALGLLVAAIAVALPRLRARPRPPRSAIVAAVAAVAVVVAAGGQVLQSRFNEGRYLGLDATVDWVIQRAPEGHRIGIAGSWGTGPLPSPILALYGPRLRNHVAYAGEVRGDTLLVERSASAFAANLRRNRYDLLLVGRGTPPLPEVQEERWARAAGFRAVARSDRFTPLRRPPSR